MTASVGKKICINLDKFRDFRYKNNGMIVNVYYESLEYQVLTENAAYSVILSPHHFVLELSQ